MDGATIDRVASQHVQIFIEKGTGETDANVVANVNLAEGRWDVVQDREFCERASRYGETEYSGYDEVDGAVGRPQW